MRRVAARDATALAVHERGQGPPLLCVPGGPGRASAYLEGLGGLDRERTLLLLDSRGSGASELPADRTSLEFPRLADDVEDVRAAFGLAPLDVLAHSAGAPVALLHAVRHPDVVRTLVLVTPGARAFGVARDDVPRLRAARRGEPWYPEAAEAAEVLDTAGPALRGELERLTRPFWYGRWDEHTRAHAEAADDQVSLRAAAGYAPGPDYDVSAARASLATVGARVLVVLGERDALGGVSAGEQLASLLPAAEVVVLPGAGHFPWVDEPVAFVAAVSAFLSAG